MYNSVGTLIGREVHEASSLVLTNNVRKLDVNVDGFYSLFNSTESANSMDIELNETKIPGKLCIDPQVLKKLCVSIVKSSVVFMFADNRGVYLEYWSPD